MAVKNMKGMTIETVERQKKYVESQKKKSNGLGIVFADAFLRGMRDIGYKNPAWSTAEKVDNAFQAGATTVSIRFGFERDNKSHTKPDMVAICDDGNGMIPEMISYAVRWGGTDREGDRKGFGRYGYGLPSSAVSLAKRYTVYSKTPGQAWHAVTVDIDQLADAAGDLKKTQEFLTPKAAKLPEWLVKAEDLLDLASLESGTVIVLEDLDRLRRSKGWIMVETLKTKLLQHFGVIYRHWIPERRVFVDGVQTQAVDPLFLMEHARFYDETPVRAVRVETRTFEVDTTRGTKGTVTIRASVLPPDFTRVDPAQHKPDSRGGKRNNRHDILRDYNGLLICRQRRQIDCIQPRWTKFQNDDAYIKIEIDFEPELDEFFGLTTAKQQIVIDDEMWEKLQHSGKNGGGLAALVKDLRGKYGDLKDEADAKARNRASKDEPRASATAMEQSEKFKSAAAEPTTSQKEDAEKNLQHVATERSDATGKPAQEVLQELIEQTKKRRWEVEFAAIPEGPFYRPMRLGEQKRVIINTDHPFYTKVYSAAAPEVQAALEVLLFVLAERELDSKGDAETFYKAERQKWSERLRQALDTLVADEAMVDKAAAIAENLHMAVEHEPLAR